jgi:hypothetical protein
MSFANQGIDEGRTRLGGQQDYCRSSPRSAL